MDPLIEGYRRFRADIWPGERARYEALAHWGQSPEAMVVACSDSRVDPQTVFGAAPGELFVVRNVAALVPVYSPDPGHHGTSAALEFGVRVLKVPRLVVLGHGQCGGVKAMAFGPPPQARDFIASWVEIGKPAVLAAGDKPEGRLERIEAEVVRLSLANLMTFPWIAEAVGAGRLVLQGFLFDDGGYFGRAFADTQNATVAGGIFGDGGEDGHGGVLSEVDVADGGDGFGTDKRDVSGENEKMVRKRSAREFEVGFEDLHGVAGAALLGLEDELNAGGGDCGSYAVGFVADDAVDVVGGDDGFGGGDDVEEESAASDLVEDFGALALEPRAFACGHDGDGECWGGHRPLWSHAWFGAY